MPTVTIEFEKLFSQGDRDLKLVEFLIKLYRGEYRGYEILLSRAEEYRNVQSENIEAVRNLLCSYVKEQINKPTLDLNKADMPKEIIVQPVDMLALLNGLLPEGTVRAGSRHQPAANVATTGTQGSAAAAPTAAATAFASAAGTSSDSKDAETVTSPEH